MLILCWLLTTVARADPLALPAPFPGDPVAPPGYTAGMMAWRSGVVAQAVGGATFGLALGPLWTSGADSPSLVLTGAGALLGTSGLLTSDIGVLVAGAALNRVEHRVSLAPGGFAFAALATCAGALEIGDPGAVKSLALVATCGGALLLPDWQAALNGAAFHRGATQPPSGPAPTATPRPALGLMPINGGAMFVATGAF